MSRTGKAWLQKCLEFRQDPSEFVNSAETLMLDMLQALWLEDIDNSVKFAMIGVLQEQETILLHTFDMVEQAVGSLSHIFLANKSLSSECKGQILTTLTAIAIDKELAERNDTSVFEEVANVLLTMAANINEVSSQYLRNIACLCLLEMEKNCPSIFRHELKQLYRWCQEERTCVFQSYLLLFSTSLSNVVQKYEGNSKNELDILSVNVGPLQKFVVPKFDSEMVVVGSGDVKKSVSLCVENLVFLTSPAQNILLSSVLDIICATDSSLATVFKNIVTQFLPTFDLPLLHFLMTLKMKLSKILFSEKEDIAVFDKLLENSTHPALSPAHRLLFMQWLQHFPDEDGVTSSEASIPQNFDSQNVSYFYPTIFDGVDTQLARIQLLSLFMTRPKYFSAEVLVDALITLRKPVEDFGLRGRATTALYRALFVYCMQHAHMRDFVSKFVVDTIVKHQTLAPQTVDFLICVRTRFDDFHVNIVETVMLELLEKVDLAPNDALFLLPLLQAAAQFDGVDVGLVVASLHHLQPVVIGPEKSASWDIGHAFLAVCAMLVHRRDIRYIHQDVCELLFVLMTEHPDFDVRDRAALYYTIFNQISPVKAAQIFSNQQHHENIANFVTGSASTYRPAQDIKCVKNIVKMTRSKTRRSHLTKSAGSLTVYFDMLLADSEHDWKEIHALSLAIGEHEFYEKLEDLFVLRLTREEKVTIGVDFRPTKTIAAHFPVMCTFSCGQGDTYRTEIPPIQLNFADLLLPIPFEDLKACEKKSDGFRSMFCREMYANDLQKDLVEFVTESGDGWFDAGFYLLPDNFMRFKVKQVNEFCSITIFLEQMDLLPLLSEYLENLCAA